MISPDAPTSPPPLARWEKIAVVLCLALFVAVGLNNIRNLAYIGQDYSFHVGCTNRLLGRPDAWFAQDVTNRPLIYWIAIDALWLTDNRATYEVASAFFLLCNAGALWLLFDTSRHFITSPALRLAALAFIAFLPATLIASVVFAADAMAQPPFALLVWSLVRWSEATPRSSAAFAALAGAALIIGNFAKFTFIAQPAAVALVAFLFWRWRWVEGRKLLPLLAFAVAVPTVTGLWLHRKSQEALSARPAWHAFAWSGTGEMTWRSLLWPRISDRRIFDAPGYWDRDTPDNSTSLPLLANNSYSYPALLHLGIFTDVLDFANKGSTDLGVPRPEPQITYSRWAVRTGVVFSIVTLASVAVFLIRLSRASLGQTSATLPPALVAWLLPGLVWYLPLVLTLPFVHHAYDWGYWLPRLIIPALWGFALCLFGLVQQWFRQRPAVLAAVALAAVLQSALHVASVWY